MFDRVWDVWDTVGSLEISKLRQGRPQNQQDRMKCPEIDTFSILHEPLSGLCGEGESPASYLLVSPSNPAQAAFLIGSIKAGTLNFYQQETVMNNIVKFPTKFFPVKQCQDPSEILALLTLKIIHSKYKKGELCDPIAAMDLVKDEFLTYEGGQLCVK